MDFSGKTVVVTGGDSGIGLAVARAFIAAGAETSILSERTSVTDTALEIGAVAGLCCDVRDAAGLATVMAQVGPIDVAIGNAGFGHPTPVDGGAEAADWFARIVAVNLIGSFHFAQAVAPLLVDGGRLIFTSSNQALLSTPGFAGYVASKHGLTGLIRSLARELGPRNITVNGICPNVVRTDALENSAATMGIATEQLSAPLVASQSLPGRLTEPDELAGTYLFLASPAAALITGHLIAADRGSTV